VNTDSCKGTLYFAVLLMGVFVSQMVCSVIHEIYYNAQCI
jgi:hypothetical protein